jgi:hypothetical protein
VGQFKCFYHTTTSIGTAEWTLERQQCLWATKGTGTVGCKSRKLMELSWRFVVIYGDSFRTGMEDE